MKKLFTKFQQLDPITRRFSVIFSVFLLIILAVIVAEILSLFNFGDTENIVLEGNILDSGGVLEVIDTEDDMYGLKLIVPSNAYDTDIEVKITIQDESELNLESIVNPITPLIIIDNGDIRAYDAMVLSIPIDIDISNEFAMAFFYDEETGNLEAIPSLSLTDDMIVIKTKHFSSIIVSKIELDYLYEQQVGSNSIDTGYLPGVNDWQFTNYGSALNPGGHCAGQSLTSAYYYMTRTKLGEANLWGLFDNDTPDFWFDDRDAYRYVSVVQKAMDFTSQEYLSYIDYSDDADYKAYNSFLYAMYITGDPQFMSVYSHNDLDEIVSGHALIIYKAQYNKLYVADPNFPGETDRFIDYNGIELGFNYYDSGDNAQSIIENGTIRYDKFSYIGLSALVDFDFIEGQYENMLDGSIGQYTMPYLALDYMEVYNSNGSQIVWTSVNEVFTINSNYNSTIPEDLENKIVISGTVGVSNVTYTIYKNNEVYKANISPAGDTFFTEEIDISNGENTYGVLVEMILHGYVYYTDYVEFTFIYDGIIEE